MVTGLLKVKLFSGPASTEKSCPRVMVAPSAALSRADFRELASLTVTDVSPPLSVGSVGCSVPVANAPGTSVSIMHRDSSATDSLEYPDALLTATFLSLAASKST